MSSVFNKPVIKHREGVDPTPLSAFSRALFIAKDEPTLEKYMAKFDKENLNYYTKANLQNVTLFSGALFDSAMTDNETKFQKYDSFRQNVEKDITFNFNNYRLSLEMMLDFVQTLLIRERKKGFEMHDFFEEVINACKSHIYKLYKEYAAGTK